MSACLHGLACMWACIVDLACLHGVRGVLDVWVERVGVHGVMNGEVCLCMAGPPQQGSLAWLHACFLS